MESEQEKTLQSKSFCDKREMMYRPFQYFLSIGNENEAEAIYRGLCNSKICELNTKCRLCNRRLLRSDLPDYHSVCLWCEENFYSFEEV